MNKGKRDLEQLHKFLRYVYGVVPIVAGIDKFSNLLTDWTEYLSGDFTKILPVDPRLFMVIIGLIEITAGIIVILNPRVGGIIVMAWLIIIAFILIFNGAYFDVAVRDLVMAAGAFTLVRLSNIITSIEINGQVRIRR